MLDTLATGLDAGLRAETIATLVAAFQRDPAARALYPDDADYHHWFPEFLVAFGGRAFEAGVVDRDADGLCAALWFPPGLDPDDEAIMASLGTSVPSERLGRLLRGFEVQAGLHPHEPHWYLPWIGVRPEAQGMGLGSGLMRLGLARADRDGLPAYLEATSRCSAALYARHDFEITGIVEAEGYPEIIAMRRPAPRVR